MQILQLHPFILKFAHRNQRSSQYSNQKNQETGPTVTGLLSICFKIIEYIIYNRIEVSINEVTPVEQAGFRKSRSCIAVDRRRICRPTSLLRTTQSGVLK